MRRLLWFTLGFATACGMGIWLPMGNWLLPTTLLCMVMCMVGWKLKWLKAGAVFLGCALGLFWFGFFMRQYLLPAHAMDGSTIQTTVTATDYSYETDYGIAVDGEFTHNGKTYEMRVYLDDYGQISPGDTITGSFRLRYTAPGGMRDPTYHAGEGILFLGYERGRAEVLFSGKISRDHWAARLRRNIAIRLDQLFPEDVSAFVRALLLGDDSDLDYVTDTALKISGIRHVIAVSGLHVAILYTILRFVTLNRRFLTALLGFPALFVFAAVAGFTPSVSRACIMVALMLAAQLLDREYDSPTALAFAALVMFLRNPLVISSISFQMSVACVAGILLFNSRIAGWLTEKVSQSKGKSLKARLHRWFVSSVSISLSAVVLTTPMSAWYFGTVSLIGIVSNLLTLWAVSLAFYGVVAAVILSLVWFKGAAILAWLVAWPVRYVIAAAKLLSKFPLAAVYTQSIYIVLWLIFVYVLLAVFAFRKNRSAKVLGCCAAIGLCASLLVSWTEHTFSDVHFTALDVGQGQCLILHNEDKTFLIDCGGSNDEIAANTAAETLLSRGITHLDGIILTHGDRDHAGGIPYLLTRIDTDFILYPATTEVTYAASLTANSSGQAIAVSDDLLLTLGEGKLTVFGPIFAAESNENSLCVLFESENCAILVTGDRGRVGESLLLLEELPDVDLLMAGHHGSKHSTGEELLTAVSPETVFISVGSNAYGHPAEETLVRLLSYGCRVYRTDLQGNLIFRR